MAHARAQAQVAEVAAVSAKLTGGQETDMAQTGVTIAGVKYMFVRGGDGEVYAKKVSHPACPPPRPGSCACLSPRTVFDLSDYDPCPHPLPVRRPPSAPSHTTCTSPPTHTHTPRPGPLGSHAAHARSQGNTGVLVMRLNQCVFVAYHGAPPPLPVHQTGPWIPPIRSRPLSRVAAELTDPPTPRARLPHRRQVQRRQLLCCRRGACRRA